MFNFCIPDSAALHPGYASIVIPAQAVIQKFTGNNRIPACAGMTGILHLRENSGSHSIHEKWKAATIKSDFIFPAIACTGAAAGKFHITYTVNQHQNAGRCLPLAAGCCHGSVWLAAARPCRSGLLLTGFRCCCPHASCAVYIRFKSRSARQARYGLLLSHP